MYWSYFLAALGVTALLAIGKNKKWGYTLGALSQIAWCAFSIATANYGFIIASIFYGYAYIQGFRNWAPRVDQ